MITFKVTYTIDKNTGFQTICKILVTGHAQNSEGALKDLCASVSTAALLTANAITLLLLKESVNVEVSSGYLYIEVKEENQIISALLENLRYTIESLNEQYPGYIEETILDSVDIIKTIDNIEPKTQLSPEEALKIIGNIPLDIPAHPHLSMPEGKKKEIQDAYRVIQLALYELKALKVNKTENLDIQSTIQRLIDEHKLSYDKVNDLNQDYSFNYPEDEEKEQPTGKVKYMIVYASRSPAADAQHILFDFIRNNPVVAPYIGDIKMYDTFSEVSKEYKYTEMWGDGTYTIIKQDENNRFFGKTDIQDWYEIKITKEIVIKVLESFSNNKGYGFEVNCKRLLDMGISKEFIPNKVQYINFIKNKKKHSKV